MRYEIEPMLSTFELLPPVVTLAMECAAIAAPPLKAFQPTIPPAAAPSVAESFALSTREEAALLQDVAFGALRMALPPPTGDAAADAARRWVALRLQEAAGSRIVPLAPMDLLCVVLHDLVHARRPRAARYLRLWLGAGAGALALWETDQAL